MYHLLTYIKTRSPTHLQHRSPMNSARIRIKYFLLLSVFAKTLYNLCFICVRNTEKLLLGSPLISLICVSLSHFEFRAHLQPRNLQIKFNFALRIVSSVALTNSGENMRLNGEYGELQKKMYQFAVLTVCVQQVDLRGPVSFNMKQLMTDDLLGTQSVGVANRGKGTNNIAHANNKDETTPLNQNDENN